MSNITSYPLQEIKNGLKKARDQHQAVNDRIRILFAPNQIDETNFETACKLYSHINLANYQTVVVVEVHTEVLDKKLPMVSNPFFKTPLGNVQVDDYMRNEFCDEDDDFFINDEAFSKEMSLFQQLMLLQGLEEDFLALSVQIADEDPAIVKELAYVLKDVLASRNTLLVFCCNLQKEQQGDLAQIKELLKEDEQSRLLNYLNKGEPQIEGAAAFIAGVMIAEGWGLKLNFLDEEGMPLSGGGLAAYAGDTRSI